MSGVGGHGDKGRVTLVVSSGSPGLLGVLTKTWSPVKGNIVLDKC